MGAIFEILLRTMAIHKTDRFSNLFQLLAVAFILFGIVLRVVIFLQDRNLFIDEANVARNIYERSFWELALPLSYEQYAPPVFMWMLKLSAVCFGYDELSLRLYPLLASLVSLGLIYLVLKKLNGTLTAWYAVGLFVVSFISLRYSTELKQYISDVMVVLGLILVALHHELSHTSRRRFLITWIVVGTVGIWAAMPSVFVLFGVGCYYFVESILRKDNRGMATIVLTALFWLAQFAIYYALILQPQIDSNYLQGFHHDFFLIAWPQSAADWEHNRQLLTNLVQEAGGYNGYALNFNLAMLLLGTVAFFVKGGPKALLVVAPLLAVIFAAALKQYSLIIRVALFILPLLLILIAYGIDTLLRLKPKVLSLVFLPLGLFFIHELSSVKLMLRGYETEQIVDAMHFVRQHGLRNGQGLYLHNGARPAFIYYTQMHPEKDQWKDIKDAHLLSWDANFEQLSRSADSLNAFIFTSVDPAELKAKVEIIARYNQLIASLDKPGCHVYIYRKRQFDY